VASPSTPARDQSDSAAAATPETEADGAAAPRRRGERPTTAREARDLAKQRLIESRLTPNAISLTGFALNIAAAVLITQDLFFLAAVTFVIGSLADVLDGRYSRMSGKGTLFGAFLDSTLDRVAEGVVLTAVGAYFSEQGDHLAVAAVVVTVLGSLMVSYTRARAEAIGVECKVGLAQRPVRVAILAVGLAFAKGLGLGDFSLLEPAIYAIAALTTVTALQRVLHVRRELASAGGV
jgi:CDP-diacylglycerol---glycerol-3-phosphate 3-phosphatidyltransferase